MMKKILVKLIIYLVVFFVLFGIWFCLTKSCVIPNWFDFKFMQPCTCNAWDNSGAPICSNCGGCSCDWGIANMNYGGNVCKNCDPNLEY